MINLKYSLMVALLVLFAACSDPKIETGVNKVSVTFPISEYCSIDVEQAASKMGIIDIGIEIDIIEFDYKNVTDLTHKYAVLRGSDIHSSAMQSAAKSLTNMCMPNSYRVFDSEHELYKMIAKEMGKNTKELGSSTIVPMFKSNHLLIYFNDDSIFRGK